MGIDYRPALVNREGIGRYTRELVRGMVEQGFDGNLGLFGYTLAPIRVPRDELGLAGVLQLLEIAPDMVVMEPESGDAFHNAPAAVERWESER